MNENTALEQTLPSSGLKMNEAGTYRFLTQEEPKGLLDHKDFRLESTLRGLVNFATSRKDAILGRKAETHFRVNTRNRTIELVVGEHGGRKLLAESNHTPTINVKAEAKKSDDYKLVMEWMGKSHSSPHDFAMILRQNEHLFESKAEWSRVVGTLRNTSVKINSLKQETSSDTGAREKRMKAEVTEGHLDLNWNWKVPIFEGEEPSLIYAEAIWEVQNNFMDVHLVLLNGGVIAQERAAIKLMFDNAVTELNGILGVNEVPMVYVD